MKSFVHLHVHSEYSLLDSPVRTEKLVELAAGLEMPAIALTDHNSLAGAVQFYQLARAAGIKPLIGCELNVGSVLSPGHGSYHLTLLASNQNGYCSLCRLITSFWLKGGNFSKSGVGPAELKTNKAGLIVLSGCRRGEIASLIARGQYREAEKAASLLKGIWGCGNFFLEIQDNLEASQRKTNRHLDELGERLNLPLVATNNVHYLFPEESETRNLLARLEKMSTTPDKLRSLQNSGEYYLKTAGRMKDLFSVFPEALDNTLKIAEECRLELEMGQTVLPAYPVPQGTTEGLELRRLCRKGLEQLYPAGKRERAGQRLKKELFVIEEMGYQGYFLLVWDMVNFARQEGIPVGPGCGSSVGSLVSYLLGVTEIDPLEHDLLFERFLNIERRTLPDIDIDFCERGREKVLQYLERRFGRGKVARVCSFSTMKSRSVLREIGRAEGLPAEEVELLCKTMPYFTPPDDIKAILKQGAGQVGVTVEKEISRRLIDGAARIGGLVRHLTVHPSAVIISDQPLENKIPLQLAKSEEVMSQYDMYSAEKIGLLKMDLLGRRSLTVTDDALSLINKEKSPSLKAEDIPLNDRTTLKTLQDGKTLGIFQLESSGIRGLIKRVPLQNNYDLAKVISLYRPGPWDSGMVDSFIRRLEGKEVVSYLHPLLEPILEETLGVMLYQEQVIKVATVLAGFSLGEADVLRWAISKRDRYLMEKIKRRFLEGVMNKEISHEIARKVFDLIMCFAGYGFNKAHALGCSLISYRAAYLKTHYPAEFMVSVLNGGMAYFPMSEYIEEARRCSVAIFPFDINRSGDRFLVEEDGLRPALNYVQDIGRATMDKFISRRREQRRYKDLPHFYRHCRQDFNRQAIGNLIKVGAFDYTGLNRRQLLFQLEKLLRSSERISSEGRLFEEGQETIPKLPPYTLEEKLRLEKRLSGLFISGNPLVPFRPRLKGDGYIYSRNLYNLKEKEEARLAGLVVARKTERTKRGDQMLFALLEDEQEMFEVIFFPPQYSEAARKVKKDRVLGIEGYVSWEGKEPKLIAHHLEGIGAY